MKVTAIILAAGQSTRMGAANKLLLPFGASTVLEHAVERVCAAGVEYVIVVTGHDGGRVRAVLADSPASVVFNPLYETGLASSIRCGILTAPPDVDGYALYLGDMPMIEPETIRRLLAAFNEQNCPSIVLPTYAGQRGHPVVFHRHFRSELLMLEGDVGARQVVRNHPEATVEIHTTDPGVIRDVDTEEAYERLRQY